MASNPARGGLRGLQRIGLSWLGAGLIAVVPAARADSPAQEQVASFHVGVFYPGGVDFVGYTREREIWGRLHGYYTFGFPALAAAGVSYYGDYAGNGAVLTAGVGLGFVAHAAVAYQWRVAERQYLKLGAGLATGVLDTGAYPVLSYEVRFKPD
jgi:hypothetical protein